MGLLDDLRNQAEGRRAQEEHAAEEQQRREAIYRDEMQPRLGAAYQYFHELAQHLNYVQPEILVEYPLYSTGDSARLRQGEYSVATDSSTDLKRVEITFHCAPDSPIEFDVAGKDAVLSQSDRLDRYFINYKRRDQKDTSLDLEAARFRIEGPLPVKIIFEADIPQSVIHLVVRNFTDPGSSNYSLQPADLDDRFLDRLGKFLLRKETVLFDRNEMPEEALLALRQRLQEEKAQRDQELRVAEAALRAEEEAARAHKTSEIIKDAVLKTVDEKKELLKDLLGKFRVQHKPDKAPGE